MVVLKSHKAFGSFLGRGTHVWLEVVLGDEKVTFSGANVQQILRVAENLQKDYDKPATRGSVVISAPAGLSEELWAKKVIKSGRAVKKQTDKAMNYSGLFPFLPGRGNCCTVVRDIVVAAGGVLPHFKPSGVAPGLKSTPY